MPRTYQRQTNKASWTSAQLQTAVAAVRNGRSVREVWQEIFNILFKTLFKNDMKENNYPDPTLVTLDKKGYKETCPGQREKNEENIMQYPSREMSEKQNVRTITNWKLVMKILMMKNRIKMWVPTTLLGLWRIRKKSGIMDKVCRVKIGHIKRVLIRKKKYSLATFATNSVK